MLPADPNLNLNLLRVFLIVASSGSFTRAAEQLGLTQPGVSKHVKTLEAYYGVRLFDRLAKKIVPTEAGELLFSAVRDVFSRIQDARVAIDELKGLQVGHLTLGASVTIGIYILPRVLRAFSDKYPGVDVAVEIELSRKIVDRVLENEVSIGLVGHLAHDERLVTRQFMTDEFLVIVPPRHPWAARIEVALEELNDQPLVISRRGSGTRTVVEELLGKMGVAPGKTIQFGNTEAVKKAVEAGLGISVLSKYAITREIQAGLLNAVPLSGIRLQRALYYTYRRDRFMTHAARAFIALLDTVRPES